MSSRTESIVSPRTLYVVATPIGNLGDMTARAREVLGAVDSIAAEDTRHTRQLLQAFGLQTPTFSLHEHNEAQKAAALMRELESGKAVALVSDAGTPLISDPGFSVVAAARAAGYAVIAVPGACAAIAALSVAGLPTDRFVFEGFLPAKPAARRERLQQLASEPRTLVFYEAPHRIEATLRDMADALGAAREVSLSRELTKRFETHYRGTLAELAHRAASDADMQRGEIVIVVRGAEMAASTQEVVDADRLLRTLAEELSPAQAAKLAARLTGAKRSELYERALRFTGKEA
jgi:16S rRNA (cytidine1402-2'-O)-methyltransferase